MWIGANDLNEDGKWRWTEGAEGLVDGGLASVLTDEERFHWSANISPDPNNVVAGFYQNWAPQADLKMHTTTIYKSLIIRSMIIQAILQ